MIKPVVPSTSVVIDGAHDRRVDREPAQDEWQHGRHDGGPAQIARIVTATTSPTSVGTLRSWARPIASAAGPYRRACLLDQAVVRWLREAVVLIEEVEAGAALNLEIPADELQRQVGATASAA